MTSRRGNGRSRSSARRSRFWRALQVVCTVTILGCVGLAALAFLWPQAEIAVDARALARVKVSPVGERLSEVSVTDQTGRRLAVVVRADRLSPVGKLAAGTTVTIQATVRRAAWIGWLVGSTETVEEAVEAPRVQVASAVLHPASGGLVSIRFTAPVSVVTLSRRGAATRRLSFETARRVVSTGVRALGSNRVGSVVVAAAARPWETVSAGVRVSWFPASAQTQTLVLPATGARLAPTQPIELTFSEPVSDVLGVKRPTVIPPTPGRWSEPDANTLAFQPAGAGFGLGTRVELVLPSAVDVVSGKQARVTRTLSWQVPAGSTLRLQQLLAQLGYLPLAWRPAGSDVPDTAPAQTAAALQPPAGAFTWRYGKTPAPLRALWAPGGWTTMIQGAVMAFEHDQGLTVDGLAGPRVWHALIEAKLAGKALATGYTYVLVHRTVPQTLVLWHNGANVLRARVNTGVPAAPTPYGTHPVFLHIASATMSGTNPNGSHYSDPGIRWISYFHGGEAIHGFNRPSYGFPQSVGCVEAPIPVAARIWRYTPIGTLVSITP